MPQITSWKAWYVDENFEIARYSSESSSPLGLPWDGAEAFVLFFSDGTKRFINGNDWYYYCDTPAGPIWGQTNNEGDITPERYPGAIKFRGKTAPDDVITAIVKEMAAQ